MDRVVFGELDVEDIRVIGEVVLHGVVDVSAFLRAHDSTVLRWRRILDCYRLPAACDPSWRSQDSVPGGEGGQRATILAKLGEDEILVQQAKSNSESQFEESPDLQASTDEAVLGAGDVLSRVSEIIFAGDANAERARQLIARAFYRSQTEGISLTDPQK